MSHFLKASNWLLLSLVMSGFLVNRRRSFPFVLMTMFVMLRMSLWFFFRFFFFFPQNYLGLPYGFHCFKHAKCFHPKVSCWLFPLPHDGWVPRGITLFSFLEGRGLSSHVSQQLPTWVAWLHTGKGGICFLRQTPEGLALSDLQRALTSWMGIRNPGPSLGAPLPALQGTWPLWMGT